MPINLVVVPALIVDQEVMVAVTVLDVNITANTRGNLSLQFNYFNGQEQNQ